MKRYIKNSTNNYNLVITIEYSISDSSYNKISASKNLEDYIPNSVYAKYDAFIINMENAFAKAGFIIAENHSTNDTNSLSEYYAIYPANKYKKPIYTVLIVLRVSDHKLKEEKNMDIITMINMLKKINIQNLNNIKNGNLNKYF